MTRYKMYQHVSQATYFSMLVAKNLKYRRIGNCTGHRAIISLPSVRYSVLHTGITEYVSQHSLPAVMETSRPKSKAQNSQV